MADAASPQGIVANALVAGGFQIKLDGIGNLAGFNGSQEIFYFTGNGDLVLFQAGGGAIFTSDQTGSTFVGNVLGRTTLLSRYNSIPTAGKGMPAIYGLDNRSGVTAADGAPITLYSVP